MLAGLDAERVHYKRFAGTNEAANHGAAEVELVRTGGCFTIEPGRTIRSCAGSTCCIPAPRAVPAPARRVISGIPNHRDEVLSDAKKAANASTMVCCSGAKSPKLVLDL